MRRSLPVGVVLAALLVMTASGPAMAQDDAASEGCVASVSPEVVLVGQPILLSGSGFTPGAVPTLSREGPEGTSSLDFSELPDTERYRVAADGTFGPLDLSSAPSGDETLERYAGTTLLSLSDGSCAAEAMFLSMAGLTWRPVDGIASADGSALNAGAVAVADDGTIVVVATEGGPGQVPGADASPGEALGWTSADATTWQPFVLPGAEGILSMDVAWTPLGFIATGFAFPEDAVAVAHVWASSDGLDWREVAVDSPKPVTGSLTPMATPDGAALLGSVLDKSPKQGKRRAGKRPVPAVWRSADGESWAFERLGRSPGSAIAGALHVLEPWVLTTDATARRPGLQTWRPDGDAWRRSKRGVRVRSSFDSRMSFAEGAGQLFVTTEADARRSSDGLRWRRVPELDGFAGALSGFGRADSAVMAVDDDGARLSFDGVTWFELPTDALAGHRIIDLAELPDGRVIVVGQADEPSAMHVWIGQPGVG